MKLPLLGLLLILAGFSNATSELNDKITLKILDYEIEVEVADTQFSRSRGLMYRDELGENDGMLFVFPEPGYYSMWMKHTFIPLSVAFINENGVILNIADMQPETLIAHDSDGLAKYALEMNMGWFLTRKIAAGTKVVGFDKFND